MATVLQFEIDTKRSSAYEKIGGENASERIYYLAQCAAWDTLRSGGTFVLVVAEGKVTMVQRTDAADIENEQQGEH